MPSRLARVGLAPPVRSARAAARYCSSFSGRKQRTTSCNGVSPSWSAAFGSAPAVSSACERTGQSCTVAWARLIQQSSHKQHRTGTAGRRPGSRSQESANSAPWGPPQATRPATHAKKHLSLSATWMAPACPLRAAMWTGWAPSPGLAVLMLTPLPVSSRTTSASPARAAMCLHGSRAVPRDADAVESYELAELS